MKPAKKKPNEKLESIWESEHRLRQEAKELAKKHIDTKPIKYLLK
jgi:hypothetical protein